jgi:hypothetical protein
MLAKDLAQNLAYPLASSLASGGLQTSYIFNFDFTERFCDDEGTPFTLQ